MPRMLLAGVVLGLFVNLVAKAQADYVFTTIDVPGAQFTEVNGI